MADRFDAPEAERAPPSRPSLASVFVRGPIDPNRLTNPHVLRTIVHNAVVHGLSGAASAMAFDVFLGLVPLLAFMGWIAGRIAQSGRTVAFEIRLLDLAPGPAAELAHSQLRRLETDIPGFAPIVLAGFLWLSSSGTHVALATIRQIIGLPQRSYLRTRLIALALTLGGVLLAGLASTAAVVVHRIRAIGIVSEREHLVWKALLFAATLGAATAGIAALYRFAAGRMRGSRSIVPGALLASLAFHGVSWAFSTYVRSLARYTAFYGGLAAVAMMMIWLWLSSLVILVGAEANAVLDELRGRTPKRRG
jgi:membrane protein